MSPRPVLAITLAISLGFPLAGCVVLDAPHGYLAPATRHGLGVG
jgi:hypothetical protein